MSADTVDARALHRRKVWGKVRRYALLTVLAIIVLFPIYITIVNSLLPPVDITRQPPNGCSILTTCRWQQWNSPRNKSKNPPSRMTRGAARPVL